MTLTEEEAKTKWCPFARGALAHVMSKSGDEQFEQLAIQPGTGYNRIQRSSQDRTETQTGMPMSCCCLGSACMAWRWRGWVNLMADGSHEVDETTGGFAYGQGKTQAPHGCNHLGYCGLAGKP